MFSESVRKLLSQTVVPKCSDGYMATEVKAKKDLTCSLILAQKTK